MAASFEIDGRIVYLRLTGEYTTRDIKDTLDAALASPAFPDDALLLMDVMASRALSDRSAGDLRDMAAHLARLSSHFGFRLGIAAASDLHYGMMRMAEAYSESGGMTARVFRSVPEAEAWLEGARPS